MIVQRKGQFPTFASQQDFIRPQRTYSLSYYTSIVAFLCCTYEYKRGENIDAVQENHCRVSF